MESAVVRCALNHALNPGPIHPASKGQHVSGLGSNHEVLFIDRAFHTAGLIRPFEVTGDGRPFLLQVKVLRGGCSVRILAVQDPLAGATPPGIRPNSLPRPLRTCPHQSTRTHWAFSNFGYCILGRVIEGIVGQPYASYVQANILAPCGISTMQIGANKESQRAANEVVYYGQYSEDPYKINVTRMDSDDGWIASSTQLVQFLNHVAGAPGIPALLKPATVQAMTTPAPAYPEGQARYARG
jgi:CubicO group peptidase (beta-lactamase class C family)